MFSILSIRLFFVQIINAKENKERLEILTLKLVDGNSSPRGRIYDRNYNLLVDNVGEKVIYYKKEKNISVKEEINIAKDLAEILDIKYDNINDNILKDFWIANNKELANNKINAEEWDLLAKRKITNYDIEKLKKERITEEELKDVDREVAYIFYLMNKGYSYEEKIIKNDNVTDTEYAYIAENLYRLKGVGVKLEWKRKYLYGSTLRGLLGTVSTQSQGIPLEYKDYYLKKGYSLNDRVGLSNLEYQYEDLLKGKKAKYKEVNGRLELYEDGMRGHDIVLSIDINLQLEVEKIIEEEMLKAMKEKNTEYFNKNFVIISDPNTGEILAMASKQVIRGNGEYKIYDYSPYISTTPIVVGSVVKGASMTVGYKTGAIEIGTKMLDECIKIKSTPEKCSWRSGLGVLDDIAALKLSSNSYQFKIAMKVSGNNYYYNMPLVIKNDAYNIYRTTFKQYGLGVKTEIDLPKESIGYVGGSSVAGHLLDYAIGQYDTYTPIQLAQYINTIANSGSRLKLNLLKEVHKPTNGEEIGELLYKVEPKELNKVGIDMKYLKRIQEGFKAVMSSGGLGVNYMDSKYNPAGKTGTAQSFYDSDFDGVIDKETYTSTFIGYAPFDNPKMSVVVASPDVSHIYGPDYRSSVNMRITKKVVDKYFDIFK
jgi:cell division protein FtsI/penicillin-binding protein 2